MSEPEARASEPEARASEPEARVSEPETRIVQVAIGKVAYDIVSDATSDTGVARLTGAASLAGSEQDLGPVELTFWGSTPEELRSRARNWPERFDAVSNAHFGVGAASEGRFDVFLSAERFFRLLDLAHGSRRAMVRLTCEPSPDGAFDLVREMEISASRG